ncbi:leucine-rich repeat-containing protein 58-like [Anneissia japonica]|uniref:leucine-rich repeat-containing protein 58-like n=1 Tax=Anneissia japonica TaxID=1529436 RepID=UPI0014259CA0|nr:leucine-rich repeat-containing protein 58-like [Anneissia japonica]
MEVTTADAADLSFVDLSRRGLEVFTGDGIHDRIANKAALKGLNISRNLLTTLPYNLVQFSGLVEIDISNNNVAIISEEIAQLRNLKTFTAKNNVIHQASLPKNFGECPALEVLNLSGNSFVDFPLQVTELTNLKALYIGSNFITEIPREIELLRRLEILYLGGNRLHELPGEIGALKQLTTLALSDNKLERLPSELTRLTNLQSLSLHNNQLTTLPTQIITLNNLCALSLRGNPLVVRFVRDFAWQPPTLLELAARSVKSQQLMYSYSDLPVNLCHYLNQAKKCVNPACKGVYFNSKVENIKFVDFCGKYRLPLMQYLCSPQCRTSSPSSSSSESESDDEDKNRIKKVLLG